MAVAQGSRHGCDADAKSVGEVFKRCSSLFHIQFMLIIDIQICTHIFCIFRLFDCKDSEFSAKIKIYSESANVYVIIFLKKFIL